MPLPIADSIETHHTVEDTTTENDLGDNTTNSMSAINTDNKGDLSNGVVQEVQKNVQQKSPVYDVKEVHENELKLTSKLVKEKDTWDIYFSDSDWRSWHEKCPRSVSRCREKFVEVEILASIANSNATQHIASHYNNTIRLDGSGDNGENSFSSIKKNVESDLSIGVVLEAHENVTQAKSILNKVDERTFKS